MGCKDKITSICEEQYATCVNFRGQLPDWSELDCPTLENTTQEIYDTLSQIKEDSDLSDLTGCINLPNNPTVKQVFQAYQNYVCNLSETIAEMQTTINQMQQEIQDLQQNNCPE